MKRRGLFVKGRRPFVEARHLFMEGRGGFVETHFLFVEARDFFMEGRGPFVEARRHFMEAWRDFVRYSGPTAITGGFCGFYRTCKTSDLIWQAGKNFPDFPSGRGNVRRSMGCRAVAGD